MELEKGITTSGYKKYTILPSSSSSSSSNSETTTTTTTVTATATANQSKSKSRYRSRSSQSEGAPGGPTGTGLIWWTIPDAVYKTITFENYRNNMPLSR